MYTVFYVLTVGQGCLEKGGNMYSYSASQKKSPPRPRFLADRTGAFGIQCRLASTSSSVCL